MPVSPGIRIGQYDVLAALGAGGMGEIYRAREPKLGEYPLLFDRNLQPKPASDAVLAVLRAGR